MNARSGFVLAVICAGFLSACGGGGGSSSLPAISNTPAPSGKPSSTPTGQPTAAPTGQPTAAPTATPGVQPTATPASHPTSTPSPVPTPTAPPTATPAPAPMLVNAAVGAVPTTAPIPAGANLTGSVALPSGSGKLSITGSNDVPPSQVNNGIGSPNRALAYFTLTAQNAAVTLNGIPGFTVSGLTGGAYFVAYYDTSASYDTGSVGAWVSTTSNGGLSDANRTVTIPATSSPTISIPANSSIYLAVYIGEYMPPINVSGCVGVNANSLSARSLVGVHPITPGNAFAYSGALSQAIVRSSPCPMPTATANAQVSVSVSETAAPGSAPAGTQTDEHSIEVDAFKTHTQTIATDSYITSNGGSLYELGETSTDQARNSVTTSYAFPGLKFAQAPEGYGNQWNNGVPSTVNSSFADGSRYARTYNPDGTYNENDVLPDGYANAIAENADGSGSLVIGTYAYGSPATIPITISAPTGNTVTMNYFGSDHSVPLWYPLPFKPYNDVTQDMGVQQVDSACGTLPSGFNPAQAEKIVRTTTTVDTVLGYIDTRTTTTWDQNSTSPQGPLCVEITDVEKLYYDYNFDTTWTVYRTSDGNPVQTNTVNEIYSLSGAPTANIVRRADASRAFAARIAAGQAGITFARSVERSQRLATFAHAFHKRPGGHR